MNKFTQFMQQANYFMFFVLVATLPLPCKIMQWCWIIWAITWLLELRFLNPSNVQWGKRMIPALFLLGWVIWESISLIWGKGLYDGGRFPDFHISLFFFPIIMLYGLNELYDWKKISKVLIIACVCSFFVYSWLLYWVINYDYVIFRHGDGATLPFQLQYFDTIFSSIKHRMLYCSALGLAIILLFILRRDLIKDWGKWKAYLFMFACLAVLVTAILATGSRANLLTLVALGAIAWMRQIKRYKPLIISAIVIAGIGACLAVWKLHPRMKNLTIDQITHIEDHYDDPDMQPRVIIWHLALQSPEDYRLHGIGAGNIEGYMGEKYISEQITAFAGLRYATHNQYLYVYMELGLVAVLLFIFFWYYIPFCFPKGSKAREFALYFVLFFGINMLTDDNMSRLEPTIYTCVSLLLMGLMAKAQTDKPALDC